MLGISGQFLLERGTGRAGQFRRRRIHHGQDGTVAIEGPVELVVALAPVQFWRNQRVDVGIDGKITGRVEARRDRKDQSEEDSSKGKPRASFNDRYDNTCQHVFSF